MLISTKFIDGTNKSDSRLRMARFESPSRFSKYLSIITRKRDNPLWLWRGTSARPCDTDINSVRLFDHFGQRFAKICTNTLLNGAFKGLQSIARRRQLGCGPRRLYGLYRSKRNLPIIGFFTKIWP